MNNIRMASVLVSNLVKNSENMLKLKHFVTGQLSFTLSRMTVSTSVSAMTNVKYPNEDIPSFDMENPFEKEKQRCILCKYNITPDYKNVKLLSQFQSPYTGRIYGRHITGLCDHKQKEVEAEIVKAQSAGLMATYLKETCFIKDPKLFDSENPIRSHRF